MSNKRAEMRRAMKKKNPQYILRKSDIEQIKQDCAVQSANEALFLMLSIPLMAFHDKFSRFIKVEEGGLSREERFMQEVLNVYDAFEQGYVTVDDLQECLEKECGIKLQNMPSKFTTQGIKKDE